jgi:hypothetical protein
MSERLRENNQPHAEGEQRPSDLVKVKQHRLRQRIAAHPDDGFLSRTDLRDLGLERRAVDSIFRACPIVSLPDYSRPLIRIRDYVSFIDANTFHGDRVRPV